MPGGFAIAGLIGWPGLLPKAAALALRLARPVLAGLADVFKILGIESGPSALRRGQGSGGFLGDRQRAVEVI
jgi:hypothetical protein